MKLNLGCGMMTWKGYVNCDFYPSAYGSTPDVGCDVRHLPFSNETADAIVSIHTWEHFSRREVDTIVEEWKRVLKRGGMLALEMPCLDKILKNFTTYPDKPYMHIFGLYGDVLSNDHPALEHKWCWSEGELVSFLVQHGFSDVRTETPQTHVPERDFRITARKP